MATRDLYNEMDMRNRKTVKLPNGAWTTVPQGLSAEEEKAELQRQFDNYQPPEIPPEIASRSERAWRKLRERQADPAENRRVQQLKKQLLDNGEITYEDLKRLAQDKNPELAARLAKPAE